MQFMQRLSLKVFAQIPVPRNPWTSLCLYRLGGFALFLFGLLAGIYLAFPNQVLRQRLAHELEASLPIQVDLAEAGLRPLLTLAGKKGVIRYFDPLETIVTIERFSLSPFWAGIFTGDPGVKGEFLVADGKLSCRWQRSGMLAMRATDMTVNLPVSLSPALRVVGILPLGKVTSVAPLQKVSKSLVDLTLEKVVLQGLEGLTRDAAGLRLGQVSLRMNGQGRAFTIERLEASGGDILVSGKGILLLAMGDPRNSRINLNLSVRPRNPQDPKMADFLALAGPPLPDGSRTLQLTGTLASPVIK